MYESGRALSTAYTLRQRETFSLILVLRRFSCNLTTPDTSLRVDVGCDDCVSAELVDEWLQARNALSIEIFLQHTRSGVHPVFCA